VQGSVTLLSGQKLPAIFPELRGMASWSTAALVRSVRSAAAANSPVAGEVAAFTSRGSGDAGKSDDALTNFVERVYYELRNLGLSSQDRAINFAATNAFQVERVFTETALANLNLQSIDVEKSPICRPSSDCWDVKLVFFDPKNKTEVAQRVFRLTVDVSDVVPVTVGKIRSWNTY
jgi:cyanobactin maturation PatA/PatG family protease